MPADISAHQDSIAKNASSVGAGREGPAQFSLRAVNGWRGPGALAIAFGHFAVVTDFFSYQTLQPIALVVDLFFVFSGLVIAQTYAAKLSNPRAFPEYVIRRFGRIWPVQAATLAALVLYELAKLAFVARTGTQPTSPPFSRDGTNLLAAVPTNLLLVHALGFHNRETWNFPSWSLSVEFFTYIAFAFFCLLKPVQRYVLSSATIAISLATLVFIAPLHMRSTFDYGIFRCFAGFFAGTLCYEIMARRRLPKWPVPTLVEIAVIFGVGAWLSLAAGGYAAFAAPIVFSIFVVIFTAERGAVSRLLAKKPFQFLAELSFTIYMVHAIVLLFSLAGLHFLAREGVASNFIDVPNPLAASPGARATMEIFHVSSAGIFAVVGLAYGAVVIGTAFLVYRFVEVPGRALFGRLGKATRRPALEPTAPILATPLVPPNDRLAT